VEVAEVLVATAEAVQTNCLPQEEVVVHRTVVLVVLAEMQLLTLVPKGLQEQVPVDLAAAAAEVAVEHLVMILVKEILDLVAVVELLEF